MLEFGNLQPKAKADNLMLESLSFDPVFPWWVLLGFALLVAGLLALRPSYGHLGPGKRSILTVLRFCAALLLLLAMLRPGWLSTETRKQSAVIPIMIDISKSMSLEQSAQGASRYLEARKVVKEIEARRAEFRDQDIDLMLYGFDGQVNGANWDSASKLPVGNAAAANATPDAEGVSALPNVPDGKLTDVVGAIDEVTGLNRRRRIAGYVMLSDGVSNTPRPRATPNEIARELESRGAPFHAMTFGPSVVSEAFVDAAVQSMPDNLTGFAENEMEFRAAVRLRGFAGQPIPVQMVVRKPDGTEEIAMTQQVIPEANDVLAQVDFNYLPMEPGSYKVTVRIPNQNREVAFTNNQLAAYMQAFPGGLRVLYVTGNLQFEQRFLVRSLEASKDIQVNFVWVDSEDQKAIFNRLFQDNTYDVFVLDNIDSAWLSNLETLQQAVLDGKGLLMLGGYHSFGPGGYASTPLAEILPIQMSPTERQDFESPIRRDLHIERPFHVRSTLDHFITRLGEEGGTNALWEELPELQGANLFNRLKPSAEVLLESENSDPILVAGNYGGRVLAFAADSTFIWARQGYQDQHQAFWRQMMLWLAARDVAGDENIWMKLSKRRLMSGENLGITAGVRSAEGEQIEGLQATATLTLPAGKEINIPIAGQLEQKQFLGKVDQSLISEGGVYKMTVSIARDGQIIGTEVQEFDVVDIDNETVVPIADPSLMQQMVDATVTEGGKMWTPDQTSTMLDGLLKATKELEVKIPQLWRLGDSSSDAGTFVIVFFVIMMLEWGLRKWWGMV